MMREMKMTMMTIKKRVQERQGSQLMSRYLCLRRFPSQCKALWSLAMASQRRRNGDNQGRHLFLPIRCIVGPWPLCQFVQPRNWCHNHNNICLLYTNLIFKLGLCCSEEPQACPSTIPSLLLLCHTLYPNSTLQLRS